eukprot:557950-Pleurochrysis_carterae.AAC.1
MSPPSLLRRLSRVMHQRDSWRTEAKRKRGVGWGDGEGTAPPTGTRKQRKSVASDAASEASIRRRVVRSARAVEIVLGARPDANRAEVVNELLLKMPPAERVKLRQMPAMQQEHFIGKRDVIAKLKREYWTTQASLDVRLSNFMPVRAMEEMRLILSKRQRDDGKWFRPVLVDLPAGAPRSSNRALGIHRPVTVPSPIVPPALLASGLDKLLDPFELKVGGADFGTATWDIRVMAGQCLLAARNDGILAEPTALVPRPRIQIMYDACTWKKGHGCTRLMLRPADIVSNFNSTRYSRDVTFYVGKDKHSDLEANLAVGGEGSIAAVLGRGATTTRAPAAASTDCYAYVTQTRLLATLGGDDGEEE